MPRRYLTRRQIGHYALRVTTAARGEPTRLTRSSRAADDLAVQLQRWLARRLPREAGPVVHDVETSAATGMSSETVLFSATWSEGGERATSRLVARVAPHEDDVPVFPSYDIPRQFETIALVARRTTVPVPGLRWCEPEPVALGSPFFVMDRVDGVVPPDLLPYNFGDSWLFSASADDRRRLQDTTVEVLARLHEVPGREAAFLELDAPGAGPLRRRVEHTRAWYEFVVADAPRSPLVERAFAWLDDHWPADEGEPVLVWGDARIGNILYADFEPAAVLDWEMACVGPRELDVSWLVYAHRCFEDLAESLGLPGMPEFLRSEDVLARYESLTGHAPRDLDFYLAYAAVQWAITFLRTGQRSVRFGERAMPGDVDDLILNRAPLERMLES
jgi:aminoglycoside phosphotransferase (APT) family kinase protein